MNELPILKLLNKADRRLRTGHRWIYSNEVDNKATPLKNFEAGQLVRVCNAKEKVLGVAYVNPHTLICARLLTDDTSQAIDADFFSQRIQQALQLRERVFPDPYYRLVYGDSDLLPGLVVDRFAGTVSVQIATAGMELFKEQIVDALHQVINPDAIVFKNDARIRQSEGLPSYVEVVHGEVDGPVRLVENAVQFETPLLEGQKTGWFYDHRQSRRRLSDYVAGKKVLDVFSYMGGWGIQAAVFGASQVSCLDSSALALEQAKHNAGLNGVADRVSTLEGDAFEVLKQLAQSGERFDVIIVDPPAFIPRRKDQKKGEQAYRRVNELAMRLLSDDGILVSASCSMHLSRVQLHDLLRRSAWQFGKQLQIIEEGGQAMDHPVHPAITETNYLKTAFTRLVK